MGIVSVAALAARAGSRPPLVKIRVTGRGQIGLPARAGAHMAIRPAIFDHNVLSFNNPVSASLCESRDDIVKIVDLRWRGTLSPARLLLPARHHGHTAARRVTR